MTDLFLGLIALGVIMLAVVQVAAMVVAARTARRVGEAVKRLEEDVRPIVAEIRPIVAEIRPIVANLQRMTAEAARMSSVAVVQAERAEQLLGDLSRRGGATAARVQASIIDPAREAFGMLQGVFAAFGVFRGGRYAPLRRRPTPVDDEDPLFIG